jgi:3-oxoacyl-[acyl-carrier-protein] synthase-3
MTGWGTALPESRLTNEDLARKLDVTEDWIAARTGIRERRIAKDNETTTSLAAQASLAALGRARLTPEDLDAVIVATITPDLRIPGAGPLLAASLGAASVWAYDLNAGCSGFLVALAQATSLVESGQASRVLVCGADLLSRITDYTDSGSCILFSDGAGAVVIESSEESCLGPFLLQSDGSRPELLRTRESDGCIEMQGREVYRRAVAEMAGSVTEAARRAGLSLDDVDLVVAHQANARILAAVAERLRLPSERFTTNIATVGNTSAASIPLALGHAAESGQLSEGDTVVLTAFGAGFTWGAGVARWTISAVESEQKAREAVVV